MLESTTDVRLVDSKVLVRRARIRKTGLEEIRVSSVEPDSSFCQVFTPLNYGGPHCELVALGSPSIIIIYEVRDWGDDCQETRRGSP